ncbi:MAG: glutamate racemase [Pseudomonas sp.]|nr:glutamate racemase [Pseudomonas sp.]
MDQSKPIGVLDSGVGGLSLFRTIREQLPNEALIYVADSGYAPYGDKCEAWIAERSAQVIAFLVGQGCKAVVIACNTITTVAVNRLRETFDIPIIAIEPAIKPAVAMTKSGVIAVMATTRTLSSESLQRLRNRVAGEVEVIFVPCPGLAERVESADLVSPEVHHLLTSLLTPALSKGADILVLGCTHYPFLTDAIQAVAGSGVQVVDPSAAVVEELKRKICALNMLAPCTNAGIATFWSSGGTAQAQVVVQSLLGYRQAISKLPEL